MKLTKENITELAVMVFDGKTSAEIAQHFNISVPTVNYHRMKFKKNGEQLRRAKKNKSSLKEATENQTKASVIELKKHPVQDIKSTPQDLTLLVNGIHVTISRATKHVYVHSTHIEIVF